MTSFTILFYKYYLISYNILSLCLLFIYGLHLGKKYCQTICFPKQVALSQTKLQGIMKTSPCNIQRFVPAVKINKESVTIWPVYAITLAAQNTVIKLLMLILYVEDNTSMSYEEIHA